MFAYTGDEIFDAQRMKAAFSQHYSVFFSPDGFVWTPYANNPVVQGGDIATCMYDPVTEEYIAFPKIHRTDIGYNRRCVGVSLSRDFTTWLTPNMILSADATDDARVATRLERFRDLIAYDDPGCYHADMYGMTGFRCAGLRMGLVWFYDISARRPRAFGGNDDGIVNIQLAYSRDPDAYSGWKRAGDRGNFLSCGDETSYDRGSIYTAHTVLEHDDELWIYYTGVNRSHGHRGASDPNQPLTRHPARPNSLNLATLRRDGFASIEALYPGGSLTTKPLLIEGERLIVNADAANGEIRVEIVDHEGQVVPGFGQEDCVPFRADEVRGEVRWKQGGSLTALQGRSVKLVFHIKTARLFSFQVLRGNG
jgi:hypothetical protein